MCHVIYTLGGRYHSAPSIKPRGKEAQVRQFDRLTQGYLIKKGLPESSGLSNGKSVFLCLAGTTQKFISPSRLLTQVWRLSPCSFWPCYSISGKCTMLVSSFYLDCRRLKAETGSSSFLCITSGLWALCLIRDRRSINISQPVPMPC